jgi:hypothetical protein
MKTAMQEHFEWLQENQLYFGIPIEAIDNAEDLLQKEKEQIIDAFEIGHKDGHYTKSNDFYNNIYNQNE